ncbi:MAG: siroheme decarboxylase subunit beta [Desulfobulbia bacterium]
MLTQLEKRVIAAIQGDIIVSERPYRQIADDLNVSEEELLEVLHSLCDRGVIRRFGATIRHQKSGFSANAMGAWQVDENRIEAVGEIMAGFKEVSHCYRRNPTVEWPYNLYTMIHAKDEKSCRETALKMSKKSGVDIFVLLFSRKELKKTSMQYFSEDSGKEDGPSN